MQTSPGGARPSGGFATQFAARRLHPELFVLTLLAAVTRFWGLLSPREVVWDEVYYERFAGSYFTHAYYVDVHPPLGKLIFVGAAKLLGIPGLVLFRDQPAPLLRVVPALAGTLIIPVVYLLLRELGSGRRTAAFGALLLLVDNAMLVESRIIVPDMIMVFAGIFALLAYAIARRSAGMARYAWLAGSAATAGVAVSIKWTGLSALGLVGLVWAIESWRDHARGIRAVAAEAALLVVIPVAIYAAAFAVHFMLLGSGGDAAMHGSFVKSFVGLNRQMQSINAGWATATHAGASPWYSWPIARHSIGYWNDIDPVAGTERWIVLFGNPVVWWGVLCGAAAIAVALIRKSKALAPRRAVLAILGAGYVANFLPFAFIQRPMFLYHYMFALVYSVLFVSVGVGALAGWDGGSEAFWRFPGVASARLFAGVAGAAMMFFLYLMPISCGWRISAAGMTHRRWILERHIGT
jgi:dolichyl-phosphate-mannose-protein mannosyltransferase